MVEQYSGTKAERKKSTLFQNSITKNWESSKKLGLGLG